jgi:hypothetical protein
MRDVSSATKEEVLDVFRDDHKVRDSGLTWPDDSHGQVEVLRKVGRPADNILKLRWKLCELDETELLAVRTVWVPPGKDNYSWSLGEMFDALIDGSFRSPDGNKLEKRIQSFRANPPSDLGKLIGYQLNSVHIGLEEGHNRLAAAAVVGILPQSFAMYIGEP